jgi:predicted methyltransferase
MIGLRGFIGMAAFASSCGVMTISASGAEGIPANIMAAVNDSGRPAADKAHDGDRRPAQTLAFAGVKPGDTVLEIEPGDGYYTRILSKAVGPTGKVYEVHPGKGGMGNQNPLNPVVALSQMPAYKNVIPVLMPGADLKIPGKADVAWTSDNYHDFHDEAFGPLDMQAFNKAIYDDLKPGGIYVVIDHATAPGKGMTQTETLHRSDPEAARKEVLAVGFKLEGQSSALAHPSDDHTQKVFALHGKEDDYLLTFKKP